MTPGTDNDQFVIHEGPDQYFRRQNFTFDQTEIDLVAKQHRFDFFRVVLDDFDGRAGTRRFEFGNQARQHVRTDSHAGTDANRRVAAEHFHGDFNFVIQPDQVARITKQFLTGLRQKKLFGQTVKQTNPVMLFQLGNRLADLLLTIYAALHQNDSEDKSRSIKWGIQRSFESPDSKYQNRVCYGYRQSESGRLIINEEEAEVVREIFRLYLEGYSIRKLIKELSSRSIFSPMGHAQWGVECIRKILSNEKYTGNVLLGKTYVGNFFDGKKVRNDGQENRYFVSESHPAIISQDQFDLVQEEKRIRSTKHRNQ